MKKFLLLTAVLLLSVVAAQAQTRKTVREFLKMADTDTTTCILRGVVDNIRNPSTGNLYLKDRTGRVLLYGVKDSIGGTRSFYQLGILVGDTLEVVGRRTRYNQTTIEMSGGHVRYHGKSRTHDAVMAQRAAERYPSFKNGDLDTFIQWVAAHVRYPAGTTAEGTVMVKFVVGRDGGVQEFELIKGVDPLLDAEALRVVRSSPKWRPAKLNGNPVRTTFTIPVEFKR